MINLTHLRYQVDLFHQELPPLPPFQVPPDSGIAAIIDHTLLKPEGMPAQIDRLCQEARQHHFAAVCVNPIFTAQVHKLLEGSNVLTCSVVGFPLGATPSAAKCFEARLCVEAGSQEIDMVIPIGLLKAREYSAVLEDIQAVVETSHAGGAIVKVILEMALLTQEEKIAGCLLSQAAGAEFVKTSTGFGPHGATVEDVNLMRRVVGPSSQTKVKAAGGIRSLTDARAMLRAGADRLGSSAGVKIMQELKAEGA
ncbi:MAG TPA: deoxyribose-phosphate aldolase [Anaerolineaceae bacterium]|nr:deoxyribose-phosphate aldolase [Anaerolineaceae bacterium]